MSYPLDIVVKHHEGAGKPRNGVQLPHYSYVIGLDEWHIRSDLVGPAAPKPGGDTSTMDFNRIVIGVCLTGNRCIYRITDIDIEMMQEIAAHARRQGWLIDHPTVKPHHDMPGSNTVCPCRKTMDRWPDIVNAYQISTSPPVGDDVPKDKDYVDSLSGKDGAWSLQYDGGVKTISGTFYGSYFSLPSSVRNDPSRRFLSMFANSDRGYSLVSVKGEVYKFNVPA
jgi:hypothetical protein